MDKKTFTNLTGKLWYLRKEKLISDQAYDKLMRWATDKYAEGRKRLFLIVIMIIVAMLMLLLILDILTRSR